MTYQFAFDGARLVELKRDEEGKYSVVAGNVYINTNALVSKHTIILNDLRLYNRVKAIEINTTPEMKLNLVQGVPGCGKTTFILNNYKNGDLVLFPTRDLAIDYRIKLQSTPD